MTFRRTLLAAFAAFALSACATPAPADPPPQAEAPVAITLQRGVCFGFCPDYTVTISGDGTVRYEGRRFVNVRGAQTATIPRADVEALLARFDDIGFERLRDAYRAQVTDLPTYTVRLTRNGTTKSVVDYGGTGAGMPESVRALQDEIDRVAGTARWVLRDGQPVRQP
ncbi:MAG: DUF6438 domain-containing protein [Hyphomonadaceae bacterium]